MPSTPGRKVHEVKENVFAKWPGSNLWFPATVLDNKNGYKVQFHDDSKTVEQMSGQFVRSAASFTKTKRSPSRSRSRGRSRTPTRARSKSRTRTKATPSPSPARRTPTRSRSKTRDKRADTPITPTRHSRRIAELMEEKKFVEDHKDELQQMKEQAKATPAPQPTRDFGGPIGAFFMILMMPITVFGMLLLCTAKSCSVYKLPTVSFNWRTYFDLQASLIVLGWIAFQAVLYLLPGGRTVEGMPLKSGRRLKYRCNGLRAMVLSCLAFAAAVYLKYPVTIVYDKFIQIMTFSCCFATMMSICLYIRSRNIPASQRSPGGNSGNFFHDFFIGRELNPRIGSFDLKFFFETRPGLIGWTMINAVLVTKQYQDLGRVDYSLLAVFVMQALYVADCFWFEPALLSTMDITHDGFGFMLAYGDIVWVPALYTLQASYLVTRPQNMNCYQIGAIVLLKLIGYWVFRGSNSQKDAFRKNPYNPALEHLKSISTSTGRRLLVSGWWGLCRHPNYLGDLIMALAWSLPCGHASIIPYFYPIYMLMLLIHRERRDDAMCAQKYRASWDRYRAQVKYRIFPYIY